MPLIPFLIAVALIGLLCWLLVTFLPMPESFKRLIPVVAIVVVLLWLLSLYFPTAGLPNLHVGR